jgi:hypothetical protein
MTDVNESDDMPTYGTSRRSAEIDKLATALAKAQGAIQNAEKTGENPAFKRDGKASKYATLTSVLDAVRKPLSENGLSVMQWPRTNGNGVELETHLLHESGQYVRDTLWLPCPQMTPHAVASLLTYMRRLTAMAVCGVAPAEAEDDDGNAATDAHKDAHKPGVPGSAGGGTDFRPAGPRQSSAYGRRMAAEEPHLIANANDRMKGTNGKKPEPDERERKIAARAAAWTENAISTLKLSGQSVDSLSRFLADNHEQIRFLEDHAPHEHERFFDVFNDVADKARAGMA